MKPNVQPRMLK